MAGIDYSSHDFRTTAWSTPKERCQPCHIPEGVSIKKVAPLWGPSNAFTISYIPYSSPTLNARVGQPDGESLECLTCHDGTIAPDTRGSTKGVGKNIHNDHPISFVYDLLLAFQDGGLNNPSNKNVSALLFNGKVQCTSCHDVHNSVDAPRYLLVMPNSYSDLCLTCHDK